MRTSVFIEDGVAQLVLTPQNEWERAALKSIESARTKCLIKHGEFYDCQGGYARERLGASMPSLIIRVERE